MNALMVMAMAMRIKRCWAYSLSHGNEMNRLTVTVQSYVVEVDMHSTAQHSAQHNTPGTQRQLTFTLELDYCIITFVCSRLLAIKPAKQRKRECMLEK